MRRFKMWCGSGLLVAALALGVILDSQPVTTASVIWGTATRAQASVIWGT
jgi:hypothetical protein